MSFTDFQETEMKGVGDRGREEAMETGIECVYAQCRGIREYMACL